MHKLLFAINHQATENAITSKVSDEYLPVDAVTYKEAVLDKLGSTGADTLLIRETLPGSMDLEKLIKRIRVEYPNVRIIVICSERPKEDPFLKMLVDLAVYDIINSNKPRISDICSYILTPRTFRDAVQYGDFLSTSTPMTQTAVKIVESETIEDQKEQGFFGKAKGLFKQIIPVNIKSTSYHGTPPNVASQAENIQQPATQENPEKIRDTSIPKVNYDLFRETVKETEERKAQTNVDAMIKKAVEEKTVFLAKENQSLQQKIIEMESALTSSDSYSVAVIKELTEIKEERDALNLLVNELRTEMQSGFDLYESQLKALQNPENTPTWYSEQSAMWDTQRDSLTKALSEKTKEADELSFKVETLVRQLQELKDKTKNLQEKLQIAQDAQLSDRGTDELIMRLRAELSESKENSNELSRKLTEVQNELSVARQGGPDYSYPIVDVPLLPDDTVYSKPNTSPQTFLFIGSKHGVGTTTAALNTASEFASRGFKTLLIEVNGDYPILNQYFEFTHIPYGFNEVIKDISLGNISNVDKAIIRPHGLSPTQANLYKTYKKLPAGLHFMLFSNKSLVTHDYANNNDLSEATIYTLLSYLIKRQQYSHIILDIQCDDHKMLQAILNSGYPVDKMIMVMTQDSHAIATAGILITTLSRARAASLVANGEFIVNRYNPAVSMTVSKIEKALHLGSTQFSRISEDSTGYFSANQAALPYVVNRGRFTMEYDSLRNKLIGV